MSDSNITVYGSDWCWDCRRTRKFLDQHHIPYQWVNIDHSKEGEAYVLKVNQGMRSVPTMVFPDGSILVEPSNSQLATKLNLQN